MMIEIQSWDDQIATAVLFASWIEPIGPWMVGASALALLAALVAYLRGTSLKTQRGLLATGFVWGMIGYLLSNLVLILKISSLILGLAAIAIVLITIHLARWARGATSA